ncbi:hypothetical protein CYY_004162 [Polysphondylium violaceum]|uniref:NAD(+)-dependent deacetylase n=1 Tax=Polysphondylium violaceum TaxID=133409 RepID=A0A8J4UZJ0_9MYCE|nr:hypothetical protein CYY_004162 [Polysphondylium violaceum]
MTEGFYVNPISCKHLQPNEFDKCINTSIFTESSITIPSVCHSCGDSSENWVCLECGVISCSKYVNGCASKHYESTKHPIAASFSDLSFWCYECDSYVHDKCLFEILDILQTIKFYSDKNDNNHQAFEDVKKRVNDLSIQETDHLIEASVTSFSTATTTTTTTNTSTTTTEVTQRIESIDLKKEDDEKSTVTITTTTNTIITSNNNNNNNNLNNSANNIKPHELNRFSKELEEHSDEENVNQQDDNKSSSSSSSSEGPNVGFIQRMIEMFKKKTYAFRESNTISESIFQPAVLQDTTLSGIANYIKSNQCKNIIVMTGAGISVAAGIPDFRSPKTGLYDSLDKYNLPYKEAIFDIEYFRENPKPFFVLSKELFPGNFKPTMVHYFIKLLHDKGLLLRNYTQNIDTLERLAGIPPAQLVEAHGSFATSRCIKCKTPHSTEYVKEKIFKDEIPQCTVCKGIVKPDIVFFGEPLPNRFNSYMEEDFPKCDLLIVIGTSLKVQPFASLINFAIGVPRVLINYEEVGVSNYGGFKFNEPSNKLDVKWIGDCQKGIVELAEKLNWKADLEKLSNSSN